MTKVNLSFIGLLLLSATICGQPFNKKYFTNTEWFSYNRDSAFFKTDTIRLIKYSNPAPKEFQKWAGTKFIEDADSNYYVKLAFNRHKDINFVVNNFIEYNQELNLGGSSVYGGITWNFNKKNNVISIYDFHNKLIVSFLPISERQIKVKSRLSVDLLSTIELTAIRVKPTP